MKLSAHDFADQMNEVMPVILKRFVRMQAEELNKGQITPPQILILEFLNRKGPSKMTDIARFMGTSTAASTGIVNRLVKSGYVIRSFDENDRRIVKIKINPKGLDLAKKISFNRRNMLINIFGRISEQDRFDYLRILKKIKDNLIEEGDQG
ncbi:MAG: MarR family transcriptional regulator [Candidatus Omnitrophica bacterium]|nr:MarR family transcriptional regulator [Candidatus Omnitrophota bacterium]